MRCCFKPLLALLLPFTLSLGLAQSPHQTRILCFGDSLTYGYGAPYGQSYPDFLQTDLLQQGIQARILKQGMSGATTKDALGRLPAVVAMHPDVAVVEFGANDGLRGMPVSITAAQLGTIIETLQRAHVRVLLAGILMPPNLGPDYVQQFDAMYPALARKYKVPLLPFILQDVYGVPGLMSGDGIHPNGEGYQVVARNLLPALLPLLRK
ncbi:MAG TPA: arylesterase [Acidobacteriaceae bacterium]